MRGAIIFQIGQGRPEGLRPLADLLAGIGAAVQGACALPADRYPLEAALRRTAGDGDVGLVLTVGGAGSASFDVAPEALSAVASRELPGMEAAIRAVLPAAEGQLFRGQAGLRAKTLLVNLPEMPWAEPALAAVLPGVERCLEAW